MKYLGPYFTWGIVAYNFPQGSDERDLRMMAATYKDADRRYGEQLGKSWPAIVAVISAVMLFGIWGGGAPAFYFLPAVIGLIVGAVAWWQRRRAMDDDGMLMEKARQWFDARGYRIRPGGAYEKKPELP